MSNPEYSFVSPRRQLFSFPPDVISSMLENPSSHKGLSKLYQTCKYFYGKRPILIAADMEFIIDSDIHENRQHKTLLFWFNGSYKNASRLQTPFGLTNILNFDTFSDSHLPNIYRCSAKKLFFRNSSLKVEDFVQITNENTVTCFNIDHRSFVYQSDRSKASIDEVLGHLPNIKEFAYFIDEKCSLEILAKLNELKFNHKFEYFKLEFRDLHPTFDFNILCEFLMKNSNDATVFRIFVAEESKEKVKKVLRNVDQKWKTVAPEFLKQYFDNVDE